MERKCTKNIAFNRTRVECKWTKILYKQQWGYTFNRTRVECKFFYYDYFWK